MKELFRKLICVILASFLVFSCISCVQPQKPEGDDSGDTPTVNPNHIFESTDTDKYVVKDGKTEYILIYPSERKTYSTKRLKQKHS